MSWLPFTLAVASLAGSVLFVLMFWFEVPDNGPYRFGTAYEVMAAIGSVLGAVLVVELSRKVTRSTVAWVLTILLAAALLLNAVSAVLFITHSIDPALSIVGSAAVLLLQGVWMFWVNRRFAEEGVYPRLLTTWGWLIGAGLVVGLLLAGIGLTFPQLSIPELLFLGPGIFIAGGVWFVWPVWYVLLGFRMLRGPGKGAGKKPVDRAKTSDRTKTTDAAGRPRGRRKA
jgi:hypothetical protein